MMRFLFWIMFTFWAFDSTTAKRCEREECAPFFCLIISDMFDRDGLYVCTKDPDCGPSAKQFCHHQMLLGRQAQCRGIDGISYCY
ncbi:unnamed protein product, partial [Mesorhabditis belari]|uniref:Uncharacterized protein n=1 Tax=Mesorhabditis belari TaxID=2138241 RepID=A0AAF3ENP3_9BILA